jgi:putative membrane protein
MMMPALMAFLHHLAAFALVAAIVVVFALFRDYITPRSARKLLVADMNAGLSAGALLIVGLLRVFYFEKGAGYYFDSIPFIAKLSLFVLVALLSVYPTVLFLSWSKALKAGRAPVVDTGKLRRVRALLHFELMGVVLILLCAALMARGIGANQP